MPCQTATNSGPQQPTTVLPQSLPSTQADWTRFTQRLLEVINSGTQTGANYVPTQLAVYDGTALPAITVTGA